MNNLIPMYCIADDSKIRIYHLVIIITICNLTTCCISGVESNDRTYTAIFLILD